MNDNKSSLEFSRWLVGFIEAEGSFSVAKRGDLQFVITQNYPNLCTLYMIQDFLGFGKVVKQGVKTFRYVVQDKVGLDLIIKFCWNQLFLKKRIRDLDRFVVAYNSFYSCVLKLPENLQRRCYPTLKDAWFSGFVDGEGCFSISYVALQRRYQIRFIVSQKDDISYFSSLFPNLGNMEHNKAADCYSFVIKEVLTYPKIKLNFKNTVPTTLRQREVIKYFKEYPLKTTKQNSFYLWSYIRKQLLFTKLTPDKHQNLILLTKLINTS
jgi:hypothetical protein